jgi:hypothetical protein
MGDAANISRDDKLSIRFFASGIQVMKLIFAKLLREFWLGYRISAC